MGNWAAAIRARGLSLRVTLVSLGRLHHLFPFGLRWAHDVAVSLSGATANKGTGQIGVTANPIGLSPIVIFAAVIKAWGRSLIVTPRWILLGQHSGANLVNLETTGQCHKGKDDCKDLHS